MSVIEVHGAYFLESLITGIIVLEQIKILREKPWEWSGGVRERSDGSGV